MSKKIKPCGDCITEKGLCPMLQMVRIEGETIFICGRKMKELSRLTKEPKEES